MEKATNRRDFMKDSLLASAGTAMAISALAGTAPAGGAEAKPADKAPPAAKQTLPEGKIGKLSVSRLILGGNLLTHVSHSRDLHYVTDLAAHYNTNEKILQTLALAERNGINTVSVPTFPYIIETLRQHRFGQGGKIQWLFCVMAQLDKDLDAYRKAVEALVKEGADMVYVFGARADMLATGKRLDLIAKAVEFGQSAGVPSGVGGHDINVMIECEKEKIPADFYVKTLHHLNYPSAPKNPPPHATLEIPGYWCQNAPKTIEVMKPITKPWIAFKVMAAGAIPPTDAFPYAFNSGADHILAGMFDFEIEQDAAIVKNAVAKANRERPWRG